MEDILKEKRGYVKILLKVVNGVLIYKKVYYICNSIGEIKSPILKTKKISKMKIQMQQHETELYFFNALCNGLDQFLSYEIEFKYSKLAYTMAKEKLSAPSYEDVLMQILKDGGTLSILDYNDGEKYTININDIYTRMHEVPVNTLLEMINENDDADTADIILQVCFLGEHTYA